MSLNFSDRFVAPAPDSCSFRGSALVIVISAMVQLGCSARLVDNSTVSPYSEVIGHVYQIVGEIEASGIYVRGSGSDPAYVALHPRANAPSGPEVTFTRSVNTGRSFRIVRAVLLDTILDDTQFYEIQLDGEAVAANVPLRIPLRRDNGEPGDGKLNAKYYARIK